MVRSITLSVFALVVGLVAQACAAPVAPAAESGSAAEKVNEEPVGTGCARFNGDNLESFSFGEEITSAGTHPIGEVVLAQLALPAHATDQLVTKKHVTVSLLSSAYPRLGTTWECSEQDGQRHARPIGKHTWRGTTWGQLPVDCSVTLNVSPSEWCDCTNGGCVDHPSSCNGDTRWSADGLVEKCNPGKCSQTGDTAKCLPESVRESH